MPFAVVTIAQHDGVPCTAQKISAITQVPAPYLSKMMQGLVPQPSHVKTRLHGGFVLTKKPSELTILEVVDAVEPFKRIRQCPMNIETHTGTLCPLHRRLTVPWRWLKNRFRKRPSPNSWAGQAVLRRFANKAMSQLSH